MFKEFDWNITIYAIAQAMERNPAFSKYCVENGHEIAAHGMKFTENIGVKMLITLPGLRWLDFWDYSLEDDKKYIKDTCLALKKATGEMPVGFYFGRGTPNTHTLCPIAWNELGAPLLYSSECYNDDVPYWVDLPYEASLPENERKGMLCIPYNYDCNDGKFHMAPGFTTSAGQLYEQYLKSTFDMLYREGGKMMNVPLHSRITGKAGRAEALRNFLKYVADKPDVWVTTRRDIAIHYREKFPYKPGSRSGGK